MAHNVSFDGPILVISLHGKVTETDLDEVATEVLGLEHGGTNAPPRLTDLRGITDAAFGYQEMARLAERVNTRPLQTPVRSAILVMQPVQLGFARMFQILNTHPQVTLRIFEDEASARDWVAGASAD